MLKSKKILITSWIMALAMVLNVFSSYSTVYAVGEENNVKDKLTNLVAEISQGEKIIDEGGTLTSDKNVEVAISFGVPVLGDDPTPQDPILKGDMAVFELGADFKLVSGGTMELTSGENLVGHVTLSTNVEGKVIATVVFDGEDEVFSGDDGILEVNCKFNAELNYDASGASDAGQDNDVSILNKTFTMKVPAKEKTFSIVKEGTVQPDRTVEWTVTVSGTQGSTALDLEGFKFTDDLTNVGTFVEGSFSAGVENPTLYYSENKLSYVFPNNSTGTQTIKFKTAIPDDKYYGVGEQKITNKAQLLDEEDTQIVESNEKVVSFTPEWIEKSGIANDAKDAGVYNPKDRTITWTIIANQMGATLKNVRITDNLDKDLVVEKAYWQTVVGETEGEEKEVILDGPGVYFWDELNSKIKLTIVTKVPDEDYASGVKNYINSASIKWDGLDKEDGISTGDVSVGIGYNPISKNGEVDTANQTVHWTIDVDTKNQKIPDMAVYDLLVYGDRNSGFDLNKVDGISDTLVKSGLVPQYNQKYVEGSFADDEIKLEVIHLEQEGKVVADLLKFTKLSDTEKNTFSFDSLVVNPDIVAGNKTSQVSNTATLFSDNKKLNDAPKTVNYDNKSLSKMMLNRSAMEDPIKGVNNITWNDSEGFDYTEKSAIFRLVVNADKLNFNSVKNVAGENLGKATVEDTLPDGWKFQEFSAGVDYYIFEGNKNADGTVTAAESPLDNITGLNSEISGETATFTFAPLDKTYVILLKAGPTDETAAGYFSKNQSTSVENKVTLTAENWDKGTTSSQWVKVNSTILDKSVKPTAEGILTWTVDYKPYDLEQQGSGLSDKLPAGIDLRTDSKGNLVLEDNIAVQEMTLNADGSYTPGASVELIVGDNITYDNESRILNFEIPDMAKAYRFTYITDVTGEQGDITNEVSLMGNDSFGVPIGRAYKISTMDSSATMQKKGWISITKEDDQGNTLNGVEFTIFSEDGETIIRQGVTASGGTLRLKAIPDGEYVLQETKTLEGYVLDSREHRLSVSEAVASIDGKTGPDGNKITVKNYQEDSVGNLTISKTVAGNAGDKEKPFDFTVTFTGADGTYDYVGSDVADGTIQSGDMISLTHGQSITVVGLPKDAAYTVSEADYSGEGYVMESIGETGTIVADTTQTAAFTNTKNIEPEVPDNQTGGLILTKTVAGIKGDKTQKFDFTVTFTGADGSYTYTGNGVADGTIKSGDTISLAHGESISITGLPEGTAYTVKEADYSDKGYTKVSTGETGIISADSVLSASYTNTRNNDVTEPEEPSKPEKPNKPEEPNKPDKPSTDNTTKPDSGNTDKMDQNTEVKKETVKKESQKNESGAPVTGDQQLGWILLSAGAMTMALVAAARVLCKKHSDK